MENVFRQSCLLQLNTSCWTGSKALEPAAMQRLGDSDWLRGKKHLIDPEYLGPIKTVIHRARKFLAKYALPFPISTLTLVPKESILTIEHGLKDFELEYWDKVMLFEHRYVTAREEAKTVLGELFRDTDYPVNIMEKFRFEWRYVTLDIPNEASVLPPEIYEQEKQKFRNLMEETRETALLAMREEFAGLISHMIERLTPGDDGKPKIMRSSMVENLNEFFSTFERRNLFDDDELRELVDHASHVLKDIQSPYALKYNDLLRKRIVQDMSRLKVAVDKSIEDLPRRRIRMQEAYLPVPLEQEELHEEVLEAA